jgi:uncharacterized lipoprotein YmbA
MNPTPIVLALTLALGGIGCLSRSTTPTFYTLDPMQGSAFASRDSGPVIGVGPATVPRYLDRPQIARRDGSRVVYDEQHRWASSLEAELLRVVGANLSALLQTDRVAVYPLQPRSPGALRVVFDVARFDGEPGRHVVLQARWAIMKEGEPEPQAVGSTALEQPAGSSFDDYIAAHNEALVSMSRQIADKIRALPSGD